MGLTLYYDPLSQPCRAVEIFMRSNGIDHENVDVDAFWLDQGDGTFAKNVSKLKTVSIICVCSYTQFVFTCQCRFLSWTTMVCLFVTPVSS